MQRSESLKKAQVAYRESRSELRVLLTNEEHEKVKSDAEKSGISIAEYVRRALGLKNAGE